MAALAKCNFKLLVWLVKLHTMFICPVELFAIKPHDLTVHEDLKDTIEKYNNDTIKMPTLTDGMIKSNIDRIWERVNEYLAGIHGHKDVPIAWCVQDTMLPKDHLLGLAIDYTSLDNEMVAHFPIILSTYSGPCDADSCNAINQREFTNMFRQDNQIVYREFSHMLGHLSFWVHENSAAKTKDDRLAYRRIYHQILGLTLWLFAMLPVIVTYEPSNIRVTVRTSTGNGTPTCMSSSTV